GERLSIVIPHGLWRLAVRPPLAAEELESYEKGRALAKASPPDPGFALWNGMAQRWREAGDTEKASWLLFTLAGRAGGKRGRAPADAAFLASQDAALEGGDHVAAGFVLTYLGRSLETRGQLEPAYARHQEALVEYWAAGRSELLEAWGLGQLARVAYDRGELDLAEAHDHRMLAIRARLPPG